MINSPFVKLADYGVRGYLRWVDDEGYEHRAGTHYSYIEVGLRAPLTQAKAPRKVLKAGETYMLEAAGTLNVAPKYHAWVVMHPWWATLGSCNVPVMVEPEDGIHDVRVLFTPRADIELKPELLHAGFVRVYCVG